MFLSKLGEWSWRRSAPRQSHAPRVPDGRRVYAIGDVHGRLDLFDTLIGRIRADHEARPAADFNLILLGDLIDRGPESAGVIERALQLGREDPSMRVVMGNHEEVFLRAIDGDARAMRLLLRVGGRATLMSYGFTDEEYEALDFEGLTERLPDRVPVDHVAFLRAMEDMVEFGDYAFVHAGVRPGIGLSGQKPSDLRWIREEFLDHEDAHDRVIVHGHSITEEIDHRSNRIGIDTGAFASGVLTAVALEGSERWFLQTGGD